MNFHIAGISFFAGISAGVIALALYLRSKSSFLLNAKNTAQQLLRTAKEESEQERREGVLRLKDEIFKKRSELELEMKKTQMELQRLEHKTYKREELLSQREVMFDNLRNELQGKERELARKTSQMVTDEARIKKIYEELVNKLEHISGLKREEAKKVLFDSC